MKTGEMEAVKYRPLQRADWEEAECLIESSFGLRHYVSDPRLQELFRRQYLQSCLAEATFTCAAECGGELAGIIMGNSRNRYRLIKHLHSLCWTAWLQFRIWTLKEKAPEGIRDFRRLHEIYAEFLGGRRGEFDGVLTLFAVRKDFQGKGIGKELFQRLVREWKCAGTSRIYLFTDSTCNVGFYEHQRLEQLEEKN